MKLHLQLKQNADDWQDKAWAFQHATASSVSLLFYLKLVPTIVALKSQMRKARGTPPFYSFKYTLIYGL